MPMIDDGTCSYCPDVWYQTAQPRMSAAMAPMATRT